MRFLEKFKRFAWDMQELAKYSVRLGMRLFGRPFYVAETLDQMYFLGVVHSFSWC